tara:strand:- start:106 stop:963 length:858 start_codon:yes stop_codon:yes gene_type:complete
MNNLENRRIIVENLKKIKLPEQRSPEWHKMRENMITASDFGSILGNNKYTSQKQVLKTKCGLGTKFVGNIFTRWGVKYEEVATDIYRYLKNAEVIEFGCIPHPKYSFLGASPDGITPDGIMLEIKVPYSRDFKENDIPPHYYDQMQGQLEVCDLDVCDFLQCKVEEYKNQSEYLEDNESEFKGSVIEYKDDENNIKFLYSKLNANKTDLQKWIRGKKISLNSKNLCFKNISYWKIIKYTIDTVNRDKDWMTNSLPIFEEFWKNVLYFREHPDELLQKKKKIVLDI